jgi:serine/threonine protein kinase
MRKNCIFPFMIGSLSVVLQWVWISDCLAVGSPDDSLSVAHDEGDLLYCHEPYSDLTSFLGFTTEEAAKLEKVSQIENLYQKQGFVDRCNQLTCAGNDLVQLVSLIEEYRSLIPSNLYYRKGQKMIGLERLAPCDFQRISAPVSGGPEELIVYPCAGRFTKGAYKNVSLAFDYLTLKGKVKVTPIEQNDAKIIQDLKNEALVVNQMSGHRGLLQAYDESIDPDRSFPYVLTQDLYLGSLKDFINSSINASDSQLSEFHHHQISQDLFEGLMYLHINDLIHRDIKPPNILVTPSGNYLSAALSDYGLMVAAKQELQKTMTTFPYIAPEAKNFTMQVQSKSFDVWALGMSLLEMNQKVNVWKRCSEGFNHGANPRKIQDIEDYCEDQLHSAIQPTSEIGAVDIFLRLNERQACSRKPAVQSWISQCAASTVRNPRIFTHLDELICTMLIPNPQCRITAVEASEAMKVICSKSPPGFCK